MIKSLYSGVTGLKSHNTRMDVIGNNIANVNTTAYKASTVTFKDVYYQTKQQSAGGDAISGGKNPRQVGYGVKLGTINQVMTQSGLTYSDSIYDCALEGDGFFQVMDKSGNIYYTRNGVFDVDNAGNLVDANGNIVLGVMGDPTGVGPSSQRIQLLVPDVQDNVASVNKVVVGGYEVTISASGYGPDGNIALTLQNSDTEFATYSNYNLQVQLDLEHLFDGMDDILSDYGLDPENPEDTADINAVYQQIFEDAVNSAIRAGGVNLPDNVVPLSISFNSLPTNINAVQASNIMEFTKGVITADTERFALKFEADLAGAFSNKYEVNMQVSTTATRVTAQWSENVLKITLPGQTDVDGNLVNDFTLEDIQNAIWEAAGGTISGGDIVRDDDDNILNADPKKLITVSIPTEEIDGFDGEDITAADLISLLGTKSPKKIGMANGEDNFFHRAATSLQTVVLEGGRYHDTQTHQNCLSISITDDGVIYGEHEVHGTIIFGRIDLATFENPGGLIQNGTSYWVASVASGVATVKRPGEEGAGFVVQGAIEMSNVDLSQEFSDMIITQRGFQANSRIITVSDTMLEELINLKR